MCVDKQQPLNLHIHRALGCYKYPFFSNALAPLTLSSRNQIPTQLQILSTALAKHNPQSWLSSLPLEQSAHRGIPPVPCSRVWAQTLPTGSCHWHLMKGFPQCQPLQSGPTDLRVIQESSKVWLRNGLCWVQLQQGRTKWREPLLLSVPQGRTQVTRWHRLCSVDAKSHHQPTSSPA